MVWALPGQIKTSVQLLATYALEGTNFPGLYVPTDEETRQAAIKWVSGSYGDPPSPVIVVQYPASLWPVSPGGLADPTFNQSVAMGVAELQRDTNGDAAPVIFGFSQGAEVGTLYKVAFNQQFDNAAPGTDIPHPTWVFFGNPNRPNGGLLERFAGLYVPGLDVTFTGATPTHTAGATEGQITTYDISGQYDPFSDFPNRPLNLLSIANAVLGTYFVHLLEYENSDMSAAVLQDRYGDTAYYLVPARRVPLLMPLGLFGVPDPLLAVLDAPLRVLIEAGYDRTISPGQPTMASFVPIANPVATTLNFLAAIPTGMDDGLQELGLGRPFGTTPAGPYGVGGPDVTLPGNTTTLASTTSVARTSPPAVTAALSPASPSTTTSQDTDSGPENSPATSNVVGTTSPATHSTSTTSKGKPPTSHTKTTNGKLPTSDTTSTNTNGSPSTSHTTSTNGEPPTSHTTSTNTNGSPSASNTTGPS